MIRIGIPLTGFENWQGGMDFISLFARCLLESGADVEFIREQKTITQNLKYAVKKLLGQSYSTFINDDIRINTVTSFRESKPALQKRYDFIGPCFCDFGFENDFGYMYDFQHRYLNKLFSTDEFAIREKQFLEIINSFSIILVNSQSVKADIQRFYPTYEGKILVLPFCANISPGWLNIESNNEHSYFLVSNQFWMHKNHEIAFEAFSEFVELMPNSKYKLICTGEIKDYRNPHRESEVFALVKKLKLEDRVIFTGFVDERQLIALYKGAQAIIQPTKFEGGPGGGSGYIAAALGKDLIISDIPVNRELEKLSNVKYFNPELKSELTNHILASASSTPEYFDEQKLYIAGRSRMKLAGKYITEKLVEYAQSNNTL